MKNYDSNLKVMFDMSHKHCDVHVNALTVTWTFFNGVGWKVKKKSTMLMSLDLYMDFTIHYVFLLT